MLLIASTFVFFKEKVFFGPALVNACLKILLHNTRQKTIKFHAVLTRLIAIYSTIQEIAQKHYYPTPIDPSTASTTHIEVIQIVRVAHP